LRRVVEEEAVDHPIPDVAVSITILVVSVAVVFTVWVPMIMYRAAIRCYLADCQVISRS